MKKVMLFFDEAGSMLDGQPTLAALLLATLATMSLIIIIRVTNNVFRVVGARIAAWSGTRITSLKFQRQELLSPDEIAIMIQRLLRGLQALLTCLILVLYAGIVFAVLPWTKDLASRMTEHIVEAFTKVGAAVLDYLPNLFLIVIIAFFAHYLIRLTDLVFSGVGSGRIRFSGFYSDWAQPTFKIVRLLIIIFALVLVFPMLPGSHSQAFRGVSIFIGILVSLGSTGAVANVIAGVVITYMRAFQIGDRVRISNTEGDIVERTLFVTRIRSNKNAEIVIPNSMVLSDHIVNYSAQARARGLVLNTTVTIGYDVPWRKVHELLIAAARDTEFIEAEPAPFVIQRSLDDFYVAYELNATTHEPNRMAKTYSEMHGNILDHFHRNGVEITSPHYSAIRDGNHVALPEDNLPRSYEAPSFRIAGIEIPPKANKKT